MSWHPMPTHEHLRHLRHGRHLVRAILAATVVAAAAPAGASPKSLQFRARTDGEAVATVFARCDRCAWDIEGREAVVFRVLLDGRYIQHLPLVRSGRAEYRLLLGAVTRGMHKLTFEEDAALTARDLRGDEATVERIDLEHLTPLTPRYAAVTRAPFVYARPDTIGRFTDVPVFMWYEVEPTERGERYRYTIVFTNEDGGTPTDRLMATWGRTTDIEYIYSIELDRNGKVVDEDMQAPKHEVLKFRGARDGLHPRLWVSTDNNMVLDKGSTAVRYGIAPIRVDLANTSRETVMDAQPWLYELSARELKREGKIVPDAPAGTSQIPDPRRFLYVEGCGDIGSAALTFAARVGDQWLSSDRGVREYRIARDGCFRAAIPLPANATADDVKGLRAQAFTRPPESGAPPTAAAPVRLTRVNRVFMLDEGYTPQTSLLSWTGALSLAADGDPVQIPWK
jgi:hypothetical protein